jgi:hypothetical protein
MGSSVLRVAVLAAIVCLLPLGLTATAKAASLNAALCDYDGPCLNLTVAGDGGAVTMFSYSSTDEWESIVYELSDVYGCEHVTATCPFIDHSIDAGIVGDPVITINWTAFGNCADSYPDAYIEFDPCNKDRSAFVLVGPLSDVELWSPYWTNHEAQVYALTGPPLGQQSYVSSLLGTTRQQWTARALS